MASNGTIQSFQTRLSAQTVRSTRAF